MSEPRTLRELRLAIREIEAELERVHMSPATVLTMFGRGYIRIADHLDPPPALPVIAWAQHRHDQALAAIAEIAQSN